VGNTGQLSASDYSASESVGLITKIEPVKHRRERWAIFLDEKFALSVSNETLAQFHLTVGQQLSSRQLDIIEQHEAYESAKKAALRYLGLRMRSERELVNYLRRKKVSPPLIARVIGYCREHHYLDDWQFAQAFVREKINLSQDGLLKIKAALLEKGLAPEIIRQVCAASDEAEQQLRRAVELGQKKLQTLASDPKARTKILRFLQQKGYPLKTALMAVKRIFAE
jgi:regulatory protein